jgi:hypothetical protein
VKENTMTEEFPETPVEETPAEETPAEEAPAEEVDPALHDYREVAEGVQARVMTDEERATRLAA